MGTWVTLRTDDRVRDVVPLFRQTEGVRIIREIDSANYGEGYDLEIGGVPARLYDDTRSDEAHADPQWKAGCCDWEEAFHHAARRLRGEAFLTFEIDRYDKHPEEARLRASQWIEQLLVTGGYCQGCIDTDPPA